MHPKYVVIKNIYAYALAHEMSSVCFSLGVGNFYGTEIEIWAGFGPVGNTEKKIWADYEQLLRPVFSCFRGQKKC